MNDARFEAMLRREAPGRWGGVPSWAFARSAFRARFLGRGAPARDARLAEWLVPQVAAVSWLRQCHSAVVLDAPREDFGPAGDGDALVVRGAGVAAVVATADCVPVIVAGGTAGAVIHAGWRGIVGGIVHRALERLGEPASAVWIGPAIGPCCYEVGPEVEAAVVDASHASVSTRPPRERPHLDLRRAVATQLAAHGIEAITIVDFCTRCHPELLSSHRRDAERAGRNLALLWLETGQPETAIQPAKPSSKSLAKRAESGGGSSST